MIKLSLGSKDFLKTKYKKNKDLFLQPTISNSDYLLIQDTSEKSNDAWIDLPNNTSFSIIEPQYLIVQVDFTSSDQADLFNSAIQADRDKMAIYQKSGSENQILIICNSNEDLSKMTNIIEDALKDLKTNKFGKIIKRYNNVEKLQF